MCVVAAEGRAGREGLAQWARVWLWWYCAAQAPLPKLLATPVEDALLGRGARRVDVLEDILHGCIWVHGAWVSVSAGQAQPADSALASRLVARKPSCGLACTRPHAAALQVPRLRGNPAWSPQSAGSPAGR